MVSSVQLFVVVGVLSVLGAQTEARARTHHTWSSRVAIEQEELETTRGLNKVLLENILPAHLAHRFLFNSQASQVDAAFVIIIIIWRMESQRGVTNK